MLEELAMGILKEFRDFAMRGNVVDMAVGVVIGAAFGSVVKSLVDHIMMPPIGALTSGVDFKSLAAKVAGVEIKYGEFINTLIQFMIIAFCLFIVIKAMNAAKARFETKEEPKPAEPPAEVKLLTEIRDILKTK
jgi:large conductance mechanosensitive channel